MDKISVLLPAYNEEQTIRECIDDVLACGVSPDNILVGDNNSTDKTDMLARSRGVRVISVPSKGKGYVVCELLKHIRTPYAVVVDSDATYKINGNIEIMRDLLNKYDAVFTYRVNCADAMSGLHKLGNKVLSLSVSILYFRYVRDCVSGMWGFHTDLARKIRFGQGGFIPDIDFVTGAIINRARIFAIPVSYFPRKDGSKSKLRFYHGIVILARILGRRLKQW